MNGSKLILAALLIVFGLATAGYCARVDESQLSTKTCSDYAIGTAPADCLNAEDVPRRDGYSTGLLTLGVVMVLVGAWIAYAAMREKKRRETPPATLGRPPRGGQFSFLPLPLLALLDLRIDSDGVSLFAGILIMVVGVLWFTGWRGAAVDRGGYVDRWDTSDKAWHAGVSFLLTIAGTVLLAVHPTTSALTVLIVGALWEAAQLVPSPRVADSWGETGQRRGFFSWRDLAADMAGVVLAWLLLALFV